MTPGTLHVVATPIGNLADASPRLRDTLARCTLVFCEDTRRTGKLLELLGVSGPRLRRCDDREEARRIPEALAAIEAGEHVALVSDAGTPAISDPGYRLVRAAHEAGLPVSVVPGASSVTAALSASGLPTHSFVFEGFLPRKSGPRRTLLASLADEPRTLVLLETPHRLAQALADMAEILGEQREVFLARELTKLHEETRLTTLGALRDRIASEGVRGEAVLVVAGAPERAAGPRASRSAMQAQVHELVESGVAEREALRIVAREHGLSRRDVYRLVKIAGLENASDDAE